LNSDSLFLPACLLHGLSSAFVFVRPLCDRDAQQLTIDCSVLLVLQLLQLLLR